VPWPQAPPCSPKTDVLSHIEVADGRIWLLPEGIDSLAGDLSEQEKKLVWATQCVPAPDLFDAKVGGTPWRSKPSWYIVAKNDRTIQPDCERFLAKRMGATTTEVVSSHVVMLSQPQVVIDVIRKAIKGAQGGRQQPKDAKPPPFFGGAAAQSAASVLNC
jgi:pimeloyl-ACP methyl ester carboxylesterase